MNNNMKTVLQIDFKKSRQTVSEQFANFHSVLLAHLSRRLIGELIVYQWSGVLRTSSVVRNAQTSSSQKPLGRSKPNFMWTLLG